MGIRYFPGYYSKQIVHVSEFHDFYLQLTRKPVGRISKRLRTFLEHGFDCDREGESFSNEIQISKHNKFHGGFHWNLRTREGFLMTSDHLVAKSKFDDKVKSNVMSNRFPMCERCNSKKANKTLEQFLKTRKHSRCT